MYIKYIYIFLGKIDIMLHYFQVKKFFFFAVF